MEDDCKLAPPTFRFIPEAAEARSAVARLSGEGIVGVDTETIWRPEGTRISLLQIAPREGEVIVIDALSTDAEVWRPLIDSPNVLMAAHNARFDEAVLAAAGLKPVGFVDTLRLARAALQLPSYSLAEVVRHLFGIILDKSFQKSNWRRRPLSSDQLAYAARDAHLTLCIYDKLEHLLRNQNRWEEAYRHAALSPQSGAEGGKRRRRTTNQSPPPPLTPDEKRIVLELKKWRLEQAFASRVPAYMICPDRTLHHLAQEKPATIDALASVYGLGESKISRYGEALLEALRQAVTQNSNR
ncbi:MAG: HRDC domain-containing protein [Pyrinomonadaceae bacterium]|jgi:ribonuclease D|nr:HRDC domain-containing protein [Pyrinomonadaceae bacterium]